MKVLIAAPYLYDANRREFSKNKTGFGIILRDILEQVRQGADVCFISHVLTKGYDGIAPHTVASVLCNAKFSDYLEAFRCVIVPELPDINRLNLAYYRLEKGFIRKTISSYAPEIVHIHGIGPGSQSYVDVCKELQVPYIVTSHGLLENATRSSAQLKEFEKEKLHEMNEEGIPISVISTGIKKRLLHSSYYGLRNKKSIHVVTNGINVKRLKPFNNIRQHYGIPQEAKIVLAIGSVYKGKNQIQIVRAYKKMPEEVKKNLWIFFAGTIDSSYPIFEEIQKDPYKDHLIMLDFVPHEALVNYYCNADLTVLASIEEGFGLSLVESFVYGVPSVTFSDLDAVPDIYNENAMLLCNERSDDALEDTIVAALEKKWNSEWIQEYSKRFSLEHMRDEYMKLYKKVLEEASSQ